MNESESKRVSFFQGFPKFLGLDSLYCSSFKLSLNLFANFLGCTTEASILKFSFTPFSGVFEGPSFVPGFLDMVLGMVSVTRFCINGTTVVYDPPLHSEIPLPTDDIK